MLVDDHVNEYTLDNGLKVFIIQDSSSSLCSVRTFIRAGSALEEQYLGSGISHYLEHLVAGGTTTKRTEDEYTHMTTLLGGAYNAYTTSDHTSYYINSLPEDVLTACDILYEWMFYCAFDQAQCDRERDVIMKEIEKNNASIARVFYYLCQENFYKYHPLQFPVIGFLENFKTLTRHDLVQYYQRYYKPSNMILVIGGNVESEPIISHIKRTFGQEKKYGAPNPSLFKEPPPFSSRFSQKEFVTNVTSYSLRFSTVDLFDDDLYPLDLLENILGSGEDSLLYRVLVDEKKVAYSVAVSSSTPSLTTGYFDISVQCDQDKVQEIKFLIFKVIEDIKKEKVTQQLLTRGKKQKLAEDIFSITSIEDKVAKIGQAYLYGHTADFFKCYVENFKGVNKDDISRVAQKYFQKNRLIETQLNPQGKKKKNKKDKQGVVKPHLKPAFLTLKSGVRVLLYPDASLPKVHVKCFVLGGLRSETKKTNGIGSLLTELCGQCSEDYSKREIKALIDDNGADMGLSVGNNTLFYSLDCLSEDLKTLFPVMADTFLRPRFKEDDIKEAKRRVVKLIEQRDDEWFSYCMYHFKKSFYQDHPYSFSSLGEEKTVQSLGKSDIEAYFFSLLNPKDMLVSVYGDIDKKEVEALVTAEFSSLKKPPKSSVPKQALDRFLHKKEVSKSMQIPQDLAVVLIGFDGERFQDIEQCMQMDLLNAVLAGLHYPVGRLHHLLRGKGYVYLAQGFHRAGLEKGHLVLCALTSKDKVEEVRDLMLDLIDDVKKNPISKEEFDKAMSQMRFYMKDRISTLESLAIINATDELYGGGYDHFLSIDKQLSKLTQSDVQKTAKKVLNSPQIMIFK